MLKIYIKHLEVNSITNIGALNIGKTILCDNRVSDIEYPETPPEEVEGAIVTPAILPSTTTAATGL